MSFEIHRPGPRVAPEVPSISMQLGRLRFFCRDEIARHGLFGFLAWFGVQIAVNLFVCAPVGYVAQALGSGQEGAAS